MSKELTKVSKYFSYLLRHNPQEIGLELDDQGWASIQELIDKTTSFNLDRDLVELVVETNDKQRFRISEDGTKIRANQGHSIDIDLDLSPIVPPAFLFHGTADRFLDSIREQGLVKMKRHHVHLSESTGVATAVGSRYGKPVILTVDSERMHRDGFQFFRSANNVWLVDRVPVEYLTDLPE